MNFLLEQIHVSLINSRIFYYFPSDSQIAECFAIDYFTLIDKYPHEHKFKIFKEVIDFTLAISKS